MATPTNYKTDGAFISGTLSAHSGSFGGFYFQGDRDKEFIQDVTKELLKKICNQRVFIYAIDWEKTKANFYGESQEKIFKDPIQTWARIMYNDPIQSLNNFTYDTKYTITVEFYSKILDDQDIKLREGDILRLGNIDTTKTAYYEITNLIYTHPQFGQTEDLIDIRATCTIARQSLITILSRNQVTPA